MYSLFKMTLFFIIFFFGGGITAYLSQRGSSNLFTGGGNIDCVAANVDPRCRIQLPPCTDVESTDVLRVEVILGNHAVTLIFESKVDSQL